MTGILPPVPEHLRAAACEVLGHVPDPDGSPCPIPDADLVADLIARIRYLDERLARYEQAYEAWRARAERSESR